MIPFNHILILALIQGITEFLPISSSAHLIILPKIAGWGDQGIELDVAMHVGSLAAVILYFWKDVVSMTVGGFNVLRRKSNYDTDLFWQMVIATIPVVLLGAVVSYWGTQHLRQIWIMAWTSIIFGIILFVVDKYSKNNLKITRMNKSKAFIVGLVQACAVVPGVSRSGACITALRAMGIERTESARYSCLLSIPTIFAAGTLMTIQILKLDSAHITSGALWAAGLSFVISLLSIAFMMNWVRKMDYTIFVVYRVALGAAMLYWFA